MFGLSTLLTIHLLDVLVESAFVLFGGVPSQQVIPKVKTLLRAAVGKICKANSSRESNSIMLDELNT